MICVYCGNTIVSEELEGTARNAGLLLAPAEGFGQGFFALQEKKELFTLFLPILGHFWCPVVTVVTLIVTFSNFEKIQKNKRRIKINNTKKITKSPKKLSNHKKKL